MKKIVAVITLLAALAILVVSIDQSQYKAAQGDLTERAGTMAQDLAGRTSARAVVDVNMTCSGKPVVRQHEVAILDLTGAWLLSPETTPPDCVGTGGEVVSMHILKPDDLTERLPLDGAFANGVGAVALQEDADQVLVKVKATATAGLFRRKVSASATAAFSLSGARQSAVAALQEALQVAAPEFARRSQRMEAAAPVVQQVAISSIPSVVTPAVLQTPNPNPSQPKPSVEPPAPTASLKAAVPPSPGSLFNQETLSQFSEGKADGPDPFAP